MVNTTQKLLHVILGTILIIIGIAGLILPILNGTVFLIIGLILISFESPYVKKKLEDLSSKNEFLHRLYLKLDTFLRKLFNRQ